MGCLSEARRKSALRLAAAALAVVMAGGLGVPALSGCRKVAGLAVTLRLYRIPSGRYLLN